MKQEPEAPPALPGWARAAIVIVLGSMAAWSALAAFGGLWPGPLAVAWLQEQLGIVSTRAVFVAVFVGLGLCALAVLVPLAIVVNVIRAARRS